MPQPAARPALSPSPAALARYANKSGRVVLPALASGRLALAARLMVASVEADRASLLPGLPGQPVPPAPAVGGPKASTRRGRVRLTPTQISFRRRARLLTASVIGRLDKANALRLAGHHAIAEMQEREAAYEAQLAARRAMEAHPELRVPDPIVVMAGLPPAYQPGGSLDPATWPDAPEADDDGPGHSRNCPGGDECWCGWGSDEEAVDEDLVAAAAAKDEATFNPDPRGQVEAHWESDHRQRDAAYVAWLDSGPLGADLTIEAFQAGWCARGMATTHPIGCACAACIGPRLQVRLDQITRH